MRQIRLTKCKAGDILSEDIYSSNGNILVARSTVMNDYIKSKLTDYGIYEVQICDSEDTTLQFFDFDSNYKEYIVLVKELLRGVAAGQFVEIEKVAFYIFDLMFNHLEQSDFITQGLHRIQNNDNYTYTHSINTAFYSMLIGNWLHLPEKDLCNLVCASLIHDIGKTKVPLDILNKHGKLEADEYQIMKQHTILGYEIVKDIPYFHLDIKNAILLHHERIDGSGYPYGLKGDAISLFARIISIADVYDAMTQNRIYKKKVSPFESFRMFLTEGNSQFDGSILYEFLSHLAPLYIGSNVELSNGEVGEIVYIPPQDITYPILSINSEYVDLSRESNIKILHVV